MLPLDLHSHSTVSDGLLRPADLVARAAQNGVRALALTDHDDVGGIAEASIAARRLGVTLIPGVEISVTWRNHTIHVVGLGIDPAHALLLAGLEAVRSGRAERARRMAESLARAGIASSLEGALRHAGNPRLVSRTHFARFLVEQGHARDVKRVFNRFLAKGKPGYVSHRWAELESAVAWIRAAGGIAILAHPGRYGIGKNAMGSLLGEFRDLGGSGIEVVTGNHTQAQFHEFAARAREFGLLASAGSDFHGPEESFVDVGRLPELPSGCATVWARYWPDLLQ
jgi:predicted metal-dependent phosphoesterase TrpH